MIKRTALLAACLFWFSTGLHADKVVLKNGNVLNGKILEITDKILRIKMAFGEMEIGIGEVDTYSSETDLEYYLSQGDMFYNSRYYDRAIEQYLIAQREFPDSPKPLPKIIEAYLAKGRHEIKHKQYTRALAAFRKVVTDYAPGNTQAQEHLEELQQTLTAIDARTDEAKKFLFAGKFENAINAFERLVFDAPYKLAELHAHIGEAYRARGAELYTQKSFKSAADMLRKALEADPDIAARAASIYLNAEVRVAIENADKRQYTEIRDRMQYATTVYPTFGYGKYLLAFALHNLNDEAAARNAYLDVLHHKLADASSLSLAELKQMAEEDLGLADGKIATFNPTTEWEQIVFKNAEELETDHFVITHFNPDLAREAAKMLEYYFTVLTARFEFSPDSVWTQKCRVTIYRDKQEYLDRTKATDWSGGWTKVVYRNASLVSQEIALYQNAPALLNATIPHELTHVFVYHIIGELRNRYPAWIHEGIAVTGEPEHRRQYLTRIARQSVEDQSELPVDTVVGSFAYPSDTSQVELFYAQSYLLARYLIEQQGMPTFLDFIKRINTSTVGEALADVYGIKDMNSLHTRWVAYVKNLK